MMVTGSTHSFLLSSIGNDQITRRKKPVHKETHTLAGALQLTENVSHASLVAHECGQVARLGGVVLGEGLDCERNENGKASFQK